MIVEDSAPPGTLVVGEARRELEWPAPVAGMPCEPCLGLAGGEAARAPRRELGV